MSKLVLSLVTVLAGALPAAALQGSDDCATPTPIAGLGLFNFDLSTATTGATGQGEALCYAFGATGIDNDVWFCWTPGADGCATMSTCGWSTTDTKIAAYAGCGCPAAGAALDCNDDTCALQSSITFAVMSGSTYTLQVGTFPGASAGLGRFELSLAPCPTPVPLQLVAHYRLDETAGTTAIDSSTNGFDGTWVGGVSLGQAGAAAGTGTSVELDDALQGHATIPTNAVFDALNEEMSVAAWIRPQSYGLPNGTARIFGNVLGSWSCGIRSAGLRFTTIGVQDYDLPASVPLDAWTHVAFVYDLGEDVSFYVDGQLAGQVAGTNPPNPASAEWRIGSWSATIEYFDGQLDDIQVYAGALAADQVAFLFANPGSTVQEGGGTPVCFGDGSGSPCPCGNEAGAGEGCGNSSGAGASLGGGGLPSIGQDGLVLTATNLLPGQPCLFFQGDNFVGGGNGLLFGDGLRCCGANVVRLVIVTPDAGGCAATDGSCGNVVGGTAGPISQHPSNGALGAGDTRCYQGWYRDPSPSAPCGSGFNLTNARSVTWVP